MAFVASVAARLSRGHANASNLPGSDQRPVDVFRWPGDSFPDGSFIHPGADSTSYQPMHETVLSVNTVKFDMGYFLQVLRLYTGNQQGSSLNSTMADQAATLIEHSEETKQAAAKVGVTVSDAEVKAEIDKQKLPSNQAYKDVIRTQLLYTKLQDNYFSKDIPATTPQRQVMAMFLESKSQVADISTQLANGGD